MPNVPKQQDVNSLRTRTAPARKEMRDPISFLDNFYFKWQYYSGFRNIEQIDKADTCTHRGKQFVHSQVGPHYATQQALRSDP
jgi:hypothetical protein